MTLDNLTDDQIDEAAAYAARRTMREEARSETCPDCLGDGAAGRCPLCAGWGTVSASLAERRKVVIASSTLARAWEAASGKDQVVS